MIRNQRIQVSSQINRYMVSHLHAAYILDPQQVDGDLTDNASTITCSVHVQPRRMQVWTLDVKLS